MGKPHKHAELIKAFSEGKEVEYRKKNFTGSLADEVTWNRVQICGTFDSLIFEYRIKPERVYPKTSYSEADLLCIFNSGGYAAGKSLATVANAAIRRYIDDQEGKE